MIKPTFSIRPHPNPLKGNAIMTRVPTIASKADVPAEHHDLVDHVTQVFGALRGPSSVLLHSPKMAWSVFNLGDYFRDQSIVEPRVRSVGILIAAQIGRA